MQISIIIPVYNAEPYVEKAVESALCQTETEEVLLIEDGSPDKCLAKCITLERAHKNVRLLRHKGGANRGASASRNLGIINAKCDYVAFLDADDYYLPNRFKVAREIFHLDETIEGIYEAIGTDFESDTAELAYKQMGWPILTTIRSGIPPEGLFEAQSPIGSSGHCSLDGLTVKKEIFEKTGLFDIELDMSEDTAFFIKLAACARLQAGVVDRPVAMRRIHSLNRIGSMKSRHRLWYFRLKMWLAVWRWFRKRMLSESRRRVIIKKMIWDCRSIVSPEWNRSKTTVISLWRYMVMLSKQPRLLMDRVFILEFVRSLSRPIR